MVDAEYRILWIDIGPSESSSVAQIFKQSKLRKIKVDSLGLPPPEPLGKVGPDLLYFLLGEDAFALMSWFVKPYSRGQLTIEERVASYRISRGRRVVENVFGILVSRFRVLLGTMEQRPKVVTGTILAWVALHNMLRTH